MLSAQENELNSVRKLLFQSLGDNGKVYMKNMKLWFSMKATKEKFDETVRKILPPELVSLHNRFLLGILNKCQTLTTPPSPTKLATKVKREESKAVNVERIEKVAEKAASQPPAKKERLSKIKSPLHKPENNSSSEHKFHPSIIWDHVPLAVAATPPRSSKSPTSEALLPSLGHLKGRLLIGAWELGLDNAEDRTADMLQMAMNRVLKSVLQTIFCCRGGYKLRDGLVHAIGSEEPNPWIQASGEVINNDEKSEQPLFDSEVLSSRIDSGDQFEGEGRAALEMATSNQIIATRLPVSVQDIVNIMQVQKQAVQSHTVYCFLMERAIARMWHPSYDELETNQTELGPVGNVGIP